MRVVGMVNGCQARQYSDQRHCAACGLVWDVNDPEPPKCKPASRRKETYNAIAARITQELPPGMMATITAQMPVTLPADVAVKMARAFYALSGADDVAKMQAAYRVFLDNLP